MIQATDRKRLLELARAALVARVRGQRAPEAPSDLDLPASGAFVTLYCHGELRGCLGTLDSKEPLCGAIVRLGGDVARNDYRFPPLRVDELDAVALDISVLTTPEAVPNPAEIVVGRDGLIIEQGVRKGLLLPQVAVEHGWDRETFLAHTCMKAGLPPDAWQKGAGILRFEAEVFGDDHC